jgi:hypothetical protein
MAGQSPGVDHRDADAGEHGRQSQAKGDDQDQPEGNLAQSDGAKQQHERRRTRQQPTGYPQCQQAPPGDRLAIGARWHMAVAARAVVVIVVYSLSPWERAGVRASPRFAGRLVLGKDKHALTLTLSRGAHRYTQLS